jgi:hypothetical protein
LVACHVHDAHCGRVDWCGVVGGCKGCSLTPFSKKNSLMTGAKPYTMKHRSTTPLQ